MSAQTRFFLGAALLFAVCSASAATQTTVGVDSTRAARVTANLSNRQQLLSQRSREGHAKSGNSTNSPIPVLPRANTLRPYPQSCLADPLPDQVSGPTYNQNVTLAAYNRNTGEIDSTEIVNIRMWRVACSTLGNSPFNSATLMRIIRNSNSQVVYPMFPSIQISQGSIGFTDLPVDANVVRIASEPNTWRVDTLIGSPILYDTTYVLENYDDTRASVFDLNLPFTLRFDNLFASNNLFYIDVPVYQPNPQTYPAAYQDIPISGYLSSNWYDPSADGEGIVLQVYEPKNDARNLTVAVGWFAFDSSGLPFWLFGQVGIPRGAKIANVNLSYLTGGGLGGNAGSAATQFPWGTATLSFFDCKNMMIDYASNPDLSSGIPTGSGRRFWIRIANVNGLACQ